MKNKNGYLTLWVALAASAASFAGGWFARGKSDSEAFGLALQGIHVSTLIGEANVIDAIRAKVAANEPQRAQQIATQVLANTAKTVRQNWDNPYVLQFSREMAEKLGFAPQVSASK